MQYNTMQKDITRNNTVSVVDCDFCLQPILHICKVTIKPFVYDLQSFLCLLLHSIMMTLHDLLNCHDLIYPYNVGVSNLLSDLMASVEA